MKANVDHSRLAKIYIEPTNQCNLACRTCIRNTWDNDATGKMSSDVFARVIEELRAFSPPPAIFFGGFGEPLFHPEIVEMVSQSKTLGSTVELITNATLLSPELSRQLIRAGLDMLWVSLDGATQESYADIRLGAALPQILDNLASFRNTLYAEGDVGDCCGFTPKTQLGIVFVAMKRNIADLPAVMDIGRRFGADNFLVTNILPYDREMVDEALYYRALGSSRCGYLQLPVMDIDDITYAPIYQAVHNMNVSLRGTHSEHRRNYCPFIASGAGAISWQGNLSPCLPLLHGHTSYLGYLHFDEHFSREWIIGNVAEQNLLELWNSPEHLAFRERVQAFDFSPCATCGSCDLSEKNEEDCFGNTFPTCGSCLWAQGVIQCP